MRYKQSLIAIPYVEYKGAVRGARLWIHNIEDSKLALYTVDMASLSDSSTRAFERVSCGNYLAVGVK